MLYIVLLHYPVYNKNRKVVTTSIANTDIHDIARIAKTYSASGFYIVNPIEEQRHLAQEIIDHWHKGYGADFNEFRKHAFDLTHLKAAFKDVIDDVKEKTGFQPKTIVTGANFSGEVLSFSELKKTLRNNQMPYLLIFGTGSGLTDELVKQSDFKLEPIYGPSGYNHLAVRSAVAIIMDKIMGV